MKTAIVTGASGGIGKAIAYSLVKEGYFVFAQYFKNLIATNELSQSLQNEKQMLFPLQMDLSDSESIKSGVDKIKASFSGVDLIVNCAGVGLYKMITETTKKEWQDLFSINVDGLNQLTCLLLPAMIERKSGKIINVSSVWGNVGASMEVCYSATKSALIGYTKALAKEVGPSGITVNCICPGVIDTSMNNRFSEAEMAQLIDSTPLMRIGKPKDVADLVSFLASEKADFITGQVITVDGGFSL